MTKCDIVLNFNFFMNVLISFNGVMMVDDGILLSGDYLELVAEMDVLCVISNCPQINNFCNGFDPMPCCVIIRG